MSVPYGGHSRYGLIGLECLDATMTRFLERADFRELDTTCVANIARPPFSTSR